MGAEKKQAVCVSNTPQNVEWVYSEDVLQELRALTDLTDGIFTKKDLLENPGRFQETRFLFSTWGMPSLTCEEIRLIFPKLECVFYSAGSVQTFAKPFLESGVKVFSAWAANAVPVAEYTVAQIILAGKGFFSLSRQMGQQDLEATYSNRVKYPGNYNVKIGLIGCGMIGSMVAKRLQDYKVEVMVFDPFLTAEKADSLGVKRCSLEDIFARCQVVSNHLANNPQTVGMLNYECFSKMLPFATFLNTGRGAQVVEADLIRVLSERADLSAVLDVTMPEPPEQDSPLYTLPNCFLTPHIAGSMGNEVIRMSEYMLTELKLYLAGKLCQYEVDLRMLETMA